MALRWGTDLGKFTVEETTAEFFLIVLFNPNIYLISVKYIYLN